MDQTWATAEEARKMNNKFHREHVGKYFLPGSMNRPEHNIDLEASSAEALSDSSYALTAYVCL
jgi:hypothetical protein